MALLIKTHALVLGSIRWKESSKITSLYTREKGKQKIIARGVYRKNSSSGGVLQTMACVEAVIDYKDGRDLQTLREISLVNNFDSLRSSQNCFFHAMAILETIDQVFEENDSDTVFFDFVITLFEQLPSSKQPHIFTSYFLLKLLSFLGFKPHFSECAGSIDLCSPIVRLNLENGEIGCKNCGALAENALELKKDEFIWLQNLQKAHHRRLLQWETERAYFPNSVLKLIQYLNYHLQHSVYLKSLSLLNGD